MKGMRNLATRQNQPWKSGDVGGGLAFSLVGKLEKKCFLVGFDATIEKTCRLNYDNLISTGPTNEA